jgi:hypothetical protein
MEGEVVDFGVRRIVERRDFDRVAVALVHGGEAAHGFRGATTSGADGGDDVKKSHGRRR